MLFRSSDVDMPRMNGIELTKRVRADTRLAGIPIVIVSYKDREEDRLAGLEAGAFDLTAALEEAYDVFAAAAEAQGSSLSFVLAPDAGGYYRGDAARIRQALLNLTSAALKVGKDAPVAVVVDWSSGELSLSVEIGRAHV